MRHNKLIDFIKDNFIHLILIVQVSIFITSTSYYATSNVDLGTIIIILLSILFTIISFIIEIYNYRRKSLIYRFNFLLLIISTFMIYDIYFNQPSSLFIFFLLSFIQLFLFSFVLDFALEKYSSKTISIIKRITRVYMMAMVVSLWVEEVVFLVLYQSLFFLLLISPLIILLLNIKGLNKYGKKIKNNYIIFSLLSFFLLVEILVMDIARLFNVKNFDYYIYISITAIFLAGIILRSLHINKKEFVNIVNKTFNKYLLSIIFILGFGFYIVGINSLIINYLLLIFIIIGFECYMIQYRNYEINSVFNTDYEDDSALVRSLNQLKREQEGKEKIAEYLHEEILQDAIYIKNQLKQKYKLSNSAEVVKMADIIIQSIRNEIDTLFPNIIRDIPLKENYYNIIRTLQIKYEDKGIGIDFYCDEKLFLISPYDVIIYRMIKELVTNIYKHSDGERGIVYLNIKDHIIYLIVENDVVSIDSQKFTYNRSTGLKTIIKEVKQLEGDIDIESLNNQVTINIEIPIKGENTYETFINR